MSIWARARVLIPPASSKAVSSVQPPAFAAIAAIDRGSVVDPTDADGHEKAQGALQLGPLEVASERRQNRSRTQGKATVASKKRAFDFSQSATEAQLHQSVAELLDRILIGNAFFTTFPAGWGKLTKGTAGRLYASGLKKGMPDILVFDWCKVLGIELKAGKNDVTSAQRAMFAKLKGVGITVYVCRSQEDVLAALCRENINFRSLHMGAGSNAREIQP